MYEYIKVKRIEIILSELSTVQSLQNTAYKQTNRYCTLTATFKTINRLTKMQNHIV